MADRYESRASTHAEGCWAWGPGHYGCAVGEIERLREMLQCAFQRGYQSGARGLREMYDAVQAVKRQDAWGNTQLTEALLAAEERAEKAEAERSALLAERDALVHDNAEYVGAASALATENQRLREALRWAAGALLAVCGDGQATELDRFTLDGVTRTGTEILDMADAALAQGQEEV